MKVGRFAGHTATLLKNGKVLVIGGGSGESKSITNSVEAYDPVTGRWSDMESMRLGLAEHTATLLPSGKVLVAGGAVSDGTTDAAAIFDPTSGTNGHWTDVGFMHTPRKNHTATLLPNGKVLVTGGDNEEDDALTSTEIYDPTSGTWTGDRTAEGRAHWAHSKSCCPTGVWLVAAGSDADRAI